MFLDPIAQIYFPGQLTRHVYFKSAKFLNGGGTIEFDYFHQPHTPSHVHAINRLQTPRPCLLNTWQLPLACAE